MALGPFILAVAPDKDTLGVWAMVIPYLSRLLQGFFSSFQYVTLVGGQVLALLTLIILQYVLSANDLKN